MKMYRYESIGQNLLFNIIILFNDNHICRKPVEEIRRVVVFNRCITALAGRHLLLLLIRRYETYFYYFIHFVIYILNIISNFYFIFKQKESCGTRPNRLRMFELTYTDNKGQYKDHSMAKRKAVRKNIYKFYIFIFSFI